MSSSEGKQYEFDIAKNRLQLIGSLVAERSAAYYEFNRNKDEETADHLLSITRTLLLELEQDGEENDFDVEKLWKKVNRMEQRLNQNSNFQYRRFRKKFEEVNRKIESIRKKSGLDIPAKTLKKEGMEMMQ